MQYLLQRYVNAWTFLTSKIYIFFVRVELETNEVIWSDQNAVPKPSSLRDDSMNSRHNG